MVSREALPRLPAGGRGQGFDLRSLRHCGRPRFQKPAGSTGQGDVHPLRMHTLVRFEERDTREKMTASATEGSTGEMLHSHLAWQSNRCTCIVRLFFFDKTAFGPPRRLLTCGASNSRVYLQVVCGIVRAHREGGSKKKERQTKATRGEVKRHANGERGVGVAAERCGASEGADRTRYCPNKKKKAAQGGKEKNSTTKPH